MRQEQGYENARNFTVAIQQIGRKLTVGEDREVAVSDDPIVSEAIEIVRCRYSLSEWAALPPREVTAQIYREVRRLDLLATGPNPALDASDRAA